MCKFATGSQIWSTERGFNKKFTAEAKLGPRGGILGEGLFTLRDLGSTGDYFQGSGERAHSYGDLGSPSKSKTIN